MLYKEVICFFILLSVILLLNHLFGHVKKVSKTLIASQPDENYQQVRKLLKDVHIKNIKYDEFDVLEYFADGGTCQVKKAMWSNGSNKKYVVLKYVRAESIQELDRELKVHRAINIKNSHENIIKFHGLRKLKEKTIITGSVFKGWEKCCENYPHYSSIPRLFKKRTLSEPDSISLNLIANERTTELLVNLQEIDKWCIEQPKNEVMKFIKQSAPNLAKLIEHKNFSINENSFAH
ncbi:15441_t:CDS:2 [Acaulospora morrowiae]|uniref:15441_t:CDS:1 n=1 Tax=Acaulospora morrowiae TaxID=94023 RepID=A0A9N8ZZZ0_9GLOM|nr:15441_t:CDS:2 [Acaulospora morrowiae]